MKYFLLILLISFVSCNEVITIDGRKYEVVDSCVKYHKETRYTSIKIGGIIYTNPYTVDICDSSIKDTILVNQ